MRICFYSALLLALAPAAPAASAHEEPVSAATVVRADPRSGRLVRRVVVSPRVVQSRMVSPARGSNAKLTPASGSEAVNAVVEELSAAHGVDPLLVHAVIQVESGYNRFALSHKGAQGLMQLIPATARRFGVRNSWDSRQNIEGGVKYLRFLQDRFDDLQLVLAAYNAGEEAVAKYRGIPPYAETQQYVYKVGARLGQLRRSQSRLLAQASKPQAVVVSEYRPLETMMDDQGRLHLRTR